MSVQNSVFGKKEKFFFFFSQQNKTLIFFIVVGNIVYEATEAQLKDFLDEIGGVISFKLQYDEKTGKSLGYGFCEFRDKEHAELAIEKLNKQEFMGRNLILGKKHTKNNRQEKISNNLKEFKSLKEMVREEGINEIVANMSDTRLLQILHQFKSLIKQNQLITQQILLNNPQLVYALLYAHVKLGIAPNIIQEITQNSKPNPSTHPVKQQSNFHPNPQQQQNMHPHPNPQQQQNFNPKSNPINNTNFSNIPPNTSANPNFNQLASMQGYNPPSGTNLFAQQQNNTTNAQIQQELLSFLGFILQTNTKVIAQNSPEKLKQIFEILQNFVNGPYLNSLNLQQRNKVAEVLKELYPLIHKN